MNPTARAMSGTPSTRSVDDGPAVTRLPAAAPPGLADHVATRVISAADVAAVAMLVEMARRDAPTVQPDLAAWLGMCLAIRAPRDGHTCVHLADAQVYVDPDIVPGVSPGTAAVNAAPAWPRDAASWIASLATAGPLVGSPGERAPFILEGERLYLARSLHEEEQIARRLVDGLAGNVEILLGGPGTGKTTQVATRLIDLLRKNPQARISLAAPTGKAAARMAEAMRARLHDEHAPPEVRDAPQEVRDAVDRLQPLTIHKLLQYRPHGTPRYAIDAANSLSADLVIVDEASMLSSSLMHRLLDAIGEQTPLLLVGDPNQLASVDAGTVLGDIETAARPGSALANRTQKLHIRPRFGPRIGALADAILAGGDAGVARAFSILDGSCEPPHQPDNTKADDPSSVRWIRSGGPDSARLVEEVVAHATRLRSLAREGHVSEALTAQKELQVLCAHRSGAAGVAGWNARVEKRLQVAHGSPWYSGRPVMVTRNSPSLGVFNGDIGIVAPGTTAGLKDLALPMAAGEPRRLSVSQLEDIETVHALTIHKSQGSQYRHAIVVLPEKRSRILTRELLYTGVTRASDRVTIVGSREVIEAAIRTPIRRATGLAARLSRSG